MCCFLCCCEGLSLSRHPQLFPGLGDHNKVPVTVFEFVQFLNELLDDLVSERVFERVFWTIFTVIV